MGTKRWRRAEKAPVSASCLLSSGLCSPYPCAPGGNGVDRRARWDAISGVKRLRNVAGLLVVFLWRNTGLIMNCSCYAFDCCSFMSHVPLTHDHSPTGG